MDGLALFCTLHADGPTTLRQLRDAGCADLGALQALGAERLARALSIEPALARRWVREARLLAERLGEGVLEREEAPPLAREPLALGADGAPGAQAARAAAGAVERDGRGSSGGAPPASLPSGERRILERVLEAWRDRDRVETPPASRAAAASGNGAAPARESELAHLPPARAEEGRTSAAASLASPLPLEPHALDGLDDATCRALRELGLGSLAELAAAEPLACARASGLAYSRVRRLVFLAGRRVSAASSRLSPADRPEAPGHGLVERELRPRVRRGALEGASSDGGLREAGAGGPFA